MTWLKDNFTYSHYMFVPKPHVILQPLKLLVLVMLLEVEIVPINYMEKWLRVGVWKQDFTADQTLLKYSCKLTDTESVTNW